MVVIVIVVSCSLGDVSTVGIVHIIDGIKLFFGLFFFDLV